MYIVRNIFKLRFDSFKDVKILLDEAYSKGLLPDVKSARILSGFTGDSYRLIFEEGYDSLAEYENLLTEHINKPTWKKWYKKFKVHVTGNQREILRQVM